MESFQELELPEFLRQSLKQMNFVKPTPVQAQAIPVALEGKDVIASAQTGTGKTGAFGLPLLTYLDKNKDKTALVLTPTRELAVQVFDVLKNLTGTHNVGGGVLLIGGANMSTQFSVLAKQPRLIIGTPGRVIDHLNRHSLNLAATGFLVLDEADRMLDMGFAPQLEEIRKRLTAPRQTLLFSATFPPDIQAMGSKYLKDPVRITVGPSTQPVAQIAQKVLYTTEAKKPEELSEELKERRGSVLIFARTQHRVDRIMNRLKDNGVKATRLHGGRTQSQRRQAIDQFREGKFDVLVATDIAARGLDIHHIAHVINYDLPRNPEDYIHRVGRTARAGAEGESLCFITPEDNDLWRRILRLMKADPKSIPVKTSRFGFTAPREEMAPRPGTPAPRPQHQQHRPQHQDQPQPQHRPQHAPRPHSQHPGQPGQGRPHQGQPQRNDHRGQRDFQHKNRHPEGRHQQRSERHHERFQKPQEGFRDNRPAFNEDDEKQPLSNESRDWTKPESFLQRIGKKFMGGGHSKPSGRNHSRDDRQGFRRDNRFDNRGGSNRRHEGQGHNRFEHRQGEQRPFSGEHRNRPENRFGEQRHQGHRPEGGNRPHRPGGNFRHKGNFRRPGEGNSRPGGFRSH